MTINLSVPQTMQELRPKITVIGVGGAGCNAVNNMIDANLEGVDFLVANTDGQSLAHSRAPRKIQLGTSLTDGLGAGSSPEMGRKAAQESLDEVLSELAESHMVFITAGMGGGTGTGAAPVIAHAAKERGILTVGVVTKPFDFEGKRRMEQADAGVEALHAYVDTLIVIPNQNLFRLANERTTLADTFHMADAVLHQGVCGVTDLMLKPGLINLDFADIRTVMSEMGKAMMGTGEASGETRATDAAESAINNPLLDDSTMKGARAVLINITGGMDMTLFEVDEAANRIRAEVDPDAVIIFGSAFDEKLEGVMRVSVVATGIDTQSMSAPLPFADTTVSKPTPVILKTELKPVVNFGGFGAPTPATAPPVAQAEAEVQAEPEAEADIETKAEVVSKTSEEHTTAVSMVPSSSKPLPEGATDEVIDSATTVSESEVSASEVSASEVSASEVSASEDGDAEPAHDTQLDIEDVASPAESPVSEDTSDLEANDQEADTSADTSTAPEAEVQPEQPDPENAPKTHGQATVIRRPAYVPDEAKDVGMDDAVTQTAVPSLPTRPSLLNRFSGIWSSKPTDAESTQESVEEKHDKQPEKTEPVLSKPDAASPKAGEPVVVKLHPDTTQTAQSDLPGTAQDEDEDEPDHDDDLDIPAFLRRQAN